ncbi:MAG TPA: 4Fe-4S dicluster domain-containing protein [Burkholderiales bacterium]|nr:4Fe-4S dicluster domain-containing protein [Burkholderiales bacterium]
MPKWGMVIDLEKCTGCQACTVACGMENSRLPGENWQDVVFFTEGEYPSVQVKWFPRPCMHCENPSCVHVCPTRATYKTEEGFVLVDWNKCIGCKYCMIACPYGVRFYTDEKPLNPPDPRKVFRSGDAHSWNPPWKAPQEDWKHGVGIQPRGVVSKCTFCYHRVSKAPKGVADLSEHDPRTRDYTPACVVACPPTARYFGDLDNPESEVSKLIANKRGVRLLDHLGNKPQVYYLAGEGGAVPSNRAIKNS